MRRDFATFSGRVGEIIEARCAGAIASEVKRDQAAELRVFLDIILREVKSLRNRTAMLQRPGPVLAK